MSEHLKIHQPQTLIGVIRIVHNSTAVVMLHTHGGIHATDRMNTAMLLREPNGVSTNDNDDDDDI